MNSLRFRTATAADRHFVVESWLDSYRTSHAAGLIAMERWKEVAGREFTAVLDRPGCKVLVAFHPGESAGSDVYGWMAYEQDAGPLVHYCYVKQAYRRLGIAKKIFAKAGIDPAAPFVHSCKTGVVSKLRASIPRARWNPLIARFPKE